MAITTTEYYKNLIAPFAEYADPVTEAAMAKYMRNQFAFYGIKAPLRRTIQKSVLQEQGLPTVDQLPELMDLMWENEYREIQLFAIDLLDKLIKKVDASFIAILEKLICTKSWWDTVDMLATHHVGYLLKKNPGLMPTYPDKWMASGNIWLQRTAIIFQLKYKQATNTDLLFNYILELKNSKEFFIQKAAGWTLREYSKTDWELVVDFIQDNELAPLTKREGLKWLKKKGVL